MLTYQDLLKVPERDKDRMEFVRRVINEHRQTELYTTALVAEEYDRHKNRTIREFQKLLYTVTGKAIPDNISANYKIASRFFNRFVTQQVQFLLGNGVTWDNPQTENKLGEDFDTKLQEAGHEALVGGVAFGFWNFDHLEVFKVTEFAPIYDEEDGSLKAGVRWWQIDPRKPFRATFYELDGWTEYIWRSGDGEVLIDKRPYKERIGVTPAEGAIIYDGENYPSFPIVPLWGNPFKQSEIVGIREQIDAYDLIKSGFANNVDDASMIYWTIQNAGGMDDVDLAQFVERIKTVKAAVVEGDGARAESHSVEAPYASREALLDRLEKDLYKDYMALNTETIASGAVTATQIRAAYEPMNNKADQFEYCILSFLQGILAIAGIEDAPTFTRSVMVNVSEEIQNIVAASAYLSADYVTEKILTVLGDGDKAEEMLKVMDADDYGRMTYDEEQRGGSDTEQFGEGTYQRVQ